MWAQLLPSLVGGTLVDHDAPNEPATITGYELTDTHVYLKCGEWQFGGMRQYMHVGAGPTEWTLHIGGYGISATATPPRKPQQQTGPSA